MREGILRLADSIEYERNRFIKLLCKEAGKTIKDADGEIREAIDFCRFYAEESKKIIPVSHKGVSGESNITYYPPRGHWLTINPWNFPLAILVGQTVAPLVMGNKVTIKASNSTSNISLAIYKLMLAAELDVEITFSTDSTVYLSQEVTKQLRSSIEILLS